MELSVLIAGDYCARERVLPLLCQNKILSKEIAEVIRANDLAIVNLECPVSEGNYKPILKEGPNLSCEPLAIRELKEMGFDVATLANNHILDFGAKGLSNTIEACSTNGIRTVGAGNSNKEASAVLYLTIHNKTIGIINCCEHEFSVTFSNEAGSNPLNPIQQYYEIKEARKKADYVIVIVHGGIETYQLPTVRMKQLYRFFIDAGADAVINHHQHCYSGYEIYNKKPIFYGLGNFCFDWINYSDNTWYEGYLVKLIFDDGEIGFETIPYVQCKEDPIVKTMNEDDRHVFDVRIQKLNAIIDDTKLLEESFVDFANKTEMDYQTVLEPYSGRILQSMYWHKLLPSTLSNKRILKLIDYIGCESHQERLLAYLFSKYNEMKNE